MNTIGNIYSLWNPLYSDSIFNSRNEEFFVPRSRTSLRAACAAVDMPAQPCAAEALPGTRAGLGSSDPVVTALTSSR